MGFASRGERCTDVLSLWYSLVDGGGEAGEVDGAGEGKIDGISNEPIGD
jgi:hypothetical protein